MKRKKLHSGPIIVKPSPLHGYGVFAAAPIQKGSLIEECHTLLGSLLDDVISDYAFHVNEEKFAIPLGYGCIYNHSNYPNASHHFDEESGIFAVHARTTIQKDEEILISYGKNWFSSRLMPVRERPLWRRVLFRTKGLIRGGIVYLGILGLTIALHYWSS